MSRRNSDLVRHVKIIFDDNHVSVGKIRGFTIAAAFFAANEITRYNEETGAQPVHIFISVNGTSQLRRYTLAEIDVLQIGFDGDSISEDDIILDFVAGD